MNAQGITACISHLPAGRQVVGRGFTPLRYPDEIGASCEFPPVGCVTAHTRKRSAQF